MRIATVLSASAIRPIAVRRLAIDDDRIEQFSGRAWFLPEWSCHCHHDCQRPRSERRRSSGQRASARVSHSLYEVPVENISLGQSEAQRANAVTRLTTLSAPMRNLAGSAFRTGAPARV
jgi:hypothetical protein